MKVLGIESSCDETAVAVVEDGRTILSNIVYSQISIHKQYGGVVPEIASRKHIEKISYVVDEAINRAGINLNDIDAVAVTYAPGLIGALLTGVNYAKGISYGLGIPLVPVNHLRGHIASNYLTFDNLEPPFLGVIISGGHSHIVGVSSYTDYKIIGRTVDDAPGELFDKISRVLGLGYPGGVEIQKRAVLGEKNHYKLTTPKLNNPYDFSFSGLKTNAINIIRSGIIKCTDDINDICASLNYKVADILVEKSICAAKEFKYNKIVLAGGVSANLIIRKVFCDAADREGIQLYKPALPLCGDNGAMIASQGFYEFKGGNIASLNLNALATKEI